MGCCNRDAEKDFCGYGGSSSVDRKLTNKFKQAINTNEDKDVLIMTSSEEVTPIVEHFDVGQTRTYEEDTSVAGGNYKITPVYVVARRGTAYQFTFENDSEGSPMMQIEGKCGSNVNVSKNNNTNATTPNNEAETGYIWGRGTKKTLYIKILDSSSHTWTSFMADYMFREADQRVKFHVTRLK